jgi:hypothetical protein
MGAVVPAHESVQDDCEFVQPVQVRRGQLLQYAVTCLGQADADNAAIVGIRCPLNQSGGLGAVDELYGAVRPQEQVASQIADRGRPVAQVSLDCHQQLMLNVGQACGLCLFFAPVLKAPQGDAELQQPLEVLLGQPSHCYIVAFQVCLAH